MKITEKEWLEDFKEFVQSDGAPVPKEVSENILSRVRADLNPSPWMVFAKLLGIHLVLGTLSLAICSQFGLNPFHTDFSLSKYFMMLGHSTCMVLCGVLFIGLTIILGRLFLQREELLVLSRNAPLQVFGLSVLSMAAFIGFGAEVVFGIGILWFLGAMLGGVVAAKAIAWRPIFAS
ncbi:MAG: hypothetical protein AB7F86_02840 [Bdellovibrionales bacterium]